MSAQTTTGTATENTINVIENNRLLTEEQLKTAVEMFATGKNRTEVAQFFIDTVPDLQVLDATDPKGLRKRLSNALRVADPTSDQFSKTKYKELYDLHRESLREVLQNKYDRAVQKYANFLERQIEKINDRIEAFQHMIDESFTHDTMPVSNPEINGTERTLQSLTDQAIRLQKELQESLQLAKEIKQNTK